MKVLSIRDASAAVRGRRRDLGLSQAQLANRVGISRKWISEFEAGKPGAELGHVLRVLEGLGLVIDLRGSSDEAGTEVSGSQPIDLDALLDELRPENTNAAE